MQTAFSLRCPGWFLRVLLVIAIAFTPLAATQAQSPSEPAPQTFDTRWLTPKTELVMVLRPRQILTAEGAELLPLEVFKAAGMKYLGVDPIQIVSVTHTAEQMKGDREFYALVFEFTQPFDMQGLSHEATRHTSAAELDGKAYLKSRDRSGPSSYQFDDKTLILATEPMLEKLLNQGSGPKSNPLIDLVTKRPATDDFYAAVDIQSLRPAIVKNLSADAEQIPPQFQKYLDIPELIRSAEFAIDLSSASLTALEVNANDSEAAATLEEMFDEAVVDIRQYIESQVDPAGQRRNPQFRIDLSVQALNYGIRILDQLLEAASPVRENDKLTFHLFDPNDPNSASKRLQQLSLLSMVTFALLPMVQQSREAARRKAAMRNLRDIELALEKHDGKLKEILLALHKYERDKKHLPAHANYSPDGKPLLSWRVHILPYLGQQELYESFQLNEPWDSDHNERLVAKMPAAFQSQTSPHEQADGKTIYVAPIGEDHIFDGTKEGIKFRQVLDGLSNTVAIVEVDPDKAVVWTKPEDLDFEPAKPLDGLGELRRGVFMAAFADGHVRPLSAKMNPEKIKRLFTKSDGEVVQLED